MKKIGIYKITNIRNNKCYVGSSIDIRKRWNKHQSELNRNIHKNIYFQNAWNKYGKDSFIWEILEECPIDKEVIIQREQYYINDLKPEYNLCPNAYSCYGVKRSDETRKRLRDALKGHTVSEETKQKLRIARARQVITDETRQKLSEARKGKPKSDAHKEKISLSHKGKPPLAAAMTICRLSDRKEMNIGNFMKWIRSQNS